MFTGENRRLAARQKGQDTNGFLSLLTPDPHFGRDSFGRASKARPTGTSGAQGHILDGSGAFRRNAAALTVWRALLCAAVSIK